MAQPEQSAAQLLRLSDTELTVADPAAEVRGGTVADKGGEEVGEAEDLLVDDREHQVRFLLLAVLGPAP